MKKKGNRIQKIISILCMILVFTLVFPCIAEAAPAAWSNDYDPNAGEKWSTPGNKGYFHISKNVLYQNVNGKDKKITSWKVKQGESIPYIIYGRGDWLYITQQNILYGVNVKSKAKKVVIRGFTFIGLNERGYGPYIYGTAPSNTDAFGPAYVWKLTGGTAKKVGTLGSHVRAVLVLNKKLFIEQYPDDGYLNHMVLVRSNPNGTGKKQQFSLKVNNGYVIRDGYSESEIKIFARDGGERKTTQYSYDVKTGKLNLVKVTEW